MIDRARIKPFLILLIAALLLLTHFWTTSRYPSLNAKAVLAASAPLSSLGFHPVFEIKPDFPFWKKVLLDTLNWMDTNRKGMTFAFLFGAFLLAMLPLLRNIRFKNGFAGSLLGLGVGAPLGVCVNCAVPISKAVRDAGASLQTALAVLIASPTMNVVVVLMMFTIFPFYVGLAKILLTLFFILVMIPLACRVCFKKETAAEVVPPTEGKGLKMDFLVPEDGEFRTWSAAFIWAVKSYFKSLFFLLKTILPLMILSGFLGTLLVTIVPWDMFSGLGDETHFGKMLLVMLALAGLGSFLPSPIAFDVIMSSVLLQAGVPLQYVAVMLFTLGTFSIYAFLIIWRFVSFRVACFLFGMTMALGMALGLIAMHFDTTVLGNAARIVAEKTVRAEMPAHFDPYTVRSDKALSYEEIKEKITPLVFDLLPESAMTANADHLSVTYADFTRVEKTPWKDFFARLNGEEIGIAQPYRLSYMLGLPQNLALNTMSVAAGDVHNDGRPDLLLMGDPETVPNVVLYANSGAGFLRQELPLPEELTDVVLVALADLDGDDWLDVIFTANSGANYVIYNDGGAFKEENLQKLGPDKDGTTMHISFADLAKNGRLDMFVGNWSTGPNYINAPQSRDMILRATEHPRGYDSEVLGGVTGETMTAQFADFNNDGNLDLYVGHDYIMDSFSDRVLLGDGKGGFTPAGEEFNQKFSGARSTMVIDGGDIDNDLQPEYYIGQIAYMTAHDSVSAAAKKRITHDRLCALENLSGEALQKCRGEVTFRTALVRAANFVTDACAVLTDEDEKNACLTHLVNYRTRCVPAEYTAGMVQKLPQDVMAGASDAASPRYMRFCDVVQKAHQAKENAAEKNLRAETLLKAGNDDNSNILLKQKMDGGYTDTAAETGTGFGGWTWNARFADLDNDGWQDLFIVNGFPASPNLDHVLFYHNNGDGTFTEAGKDFGLTGYGYTAAYSYLDLNNDGALDIVTVPTDAPVRIYLNEKGIAKNAVQIALRDNKTCNTRGLGAKIIITYQENGEEKRQMREIKGSGGYKSYDQPLAHFGLDTAESISAIEIAWPDGGTSRIEGAFAAGRQYRLSRRGE